MVCITFHHSGCTGYNFKIYKLHEKLFKIKCIFFLKKKKRRYIHGKPTRRKTVVNVVLIVNETSMEFNQGKMEKRAQTNSCTSINHMGQNQKQSLGIYYVIFKHTFHKSMTLMGCVHLALWV